MSVAFSPDGKQLAGGGGYSVSVDGGTRSVGELHVWDVDTGKLGFSVTDLLGSVRYLAYSPNGKVLATGSNGPITQVSPNGKRKWVSSELRLSDAATGKVNSTIVGKLGDVSSLAFSPDGETLVWCDIEEVAFLKIATGVKWVALMVVTRQPIRSANK